MNEGLHYEGVLEKAGKRFFEGFRKRWFILDGKNLSYYKARETTPENLLGIIDLTKVKAVVPFKMINNNAFQIITNTRTYTFTAATTQLMTEWISVLRQAMQLKSFINKRANKSFRTPSVDDAGYEVVRSSRTSSEMSDQACGDDNLYDQVTDQVTSPGNEDATKNFPIATYEAVGSFKHPSPGGQNTDQGSYGLITVPVEQNIEAYGSVGPAINKSSSEDPPQVGTYGVIGGSHVQTPNTTDMYAVVQKPRQSKAKDSETVQSMYAEVKSVDAKPTPKIIVAPMSIICESDDDDDDDDDNEDKVGDSTFVEENSEEIQDPLPPPKRNSYAIDQIRLLLKELKKDESAESRQESHVVQDQETTDNTVIPDTCERAFTKLKEFLNKLENN